MRKVFGISFILFLIDFIVKIIIITNFKLNQELILIQDFFSITYVKNNGAAFSILPGWRIVFILMAIFVLYILYKMVRSEKKYNKLNTALYSLLIAGVLGNLIDRIVHHAVIDYFAFTLFNYQFPIFNLADSFIIVAVSIYLVTVLLKKEVFHQ